MPFALLACLPFLVPPLAAQQAEDAEAVAGQMMTVEDLERFIEQRKAELERARENRSDTAERARRAERALAEQRERQAAAESELEALCRERETLEPGSYDGCLTSGGN